MHAHLFIPCLVEHFRPEIGEATARVLARLGVVPVVPSGQTCCGQPLYKTGFADEVRALAEHFLDLFDDAEAVVSPSGSCVAMIRAYPSLFEDVSLRRRAEETASRTFEFSEFLVERLGVTDAGAGFRARAAYHDSCQVGRGLGVRRPPRTLLAGVRGLELVELASSDDCCGFGGAFSARFPEISGAIREAKVRDILASGAEVVVAAEVSCLSHIARGLRDAGADHVRAMHVAEVLDQGFASGSEEAAS